MNDLRTALRHLRRHPGTTFANVTGLAVGMACCMIIALFVRDELGYDRFHEKADRIFRVALHLRDGDRETHTARTPAALSRLLEHDLPAVEQATRFWRDPPGTMVVRRENRAFPEDGVLFADANVFEVFTFPLLRGDAATALRDPHTIVLTERAARKYFSGEDPLGKTLMLRPPADNDLFEYRVTGVVADPPARSHLPFDFLASFSSQELSRSKTLGSAGLYSPWTYILLREGADPAAVAEALPVLVDRHAARRMRERLRGAGDHYRLDLQPLTRIHLHSSLDGEPARGGDIRYVYFFSAIALFVLLLACVNFINLATARAADRALEVGVRKAVGSGRSRLVAQFLAESTLLSLLALVLAVAIVRPVLPLLAGLTGKDLAASLPGTSGCLPAMVAFAVLVGGAAGFYPAFVLSAFRPAAVLKAGGATGGRGSRVRGVLVAFQFTVSIVLVVATAVVHRQMEYVQDTRLGFAAEKLVVLEGAEVMKRQIGPFKEHLLSLPFVTGVTNAELTPARPLDGTLFRVEGAPPDELVPLHYTYVGLDFAETFGLELVAGRGLVRDRAGDSLGVLLNETAVRRLGLSDPVGKRLVWPNESTYTIVGVVRDFHFASLRQEIGPLALLGPDPRNTNRPNLLVVARVASGDLPGTLAAMESAWKAFAPGHPFVYRFLDDDFDALYRSERLTARLFGAFAIVALLIACFGVLGLAAHAAERRTKEIGIRKVLGATVTGIVVLLSKDFLRLVAFGFVAAMPVAHFLMSRWLDDFAYRADMPWPVFLAAGLVVLLAAFLTVSTQAVRAALSNPVDNLRYE